MKHILLCLLLIALTSCYESYEGSKKKRVAFADKTEEIVVGVAWPEEDDNFMKGVRLATKELNRKGVIDRQRIKLIVDTSEKEAYSLPIRQGQKVSISVANSFASNPEVISVIGHRSSSFAIPATVVYQNHGILFIAPTSTNLNLTIHNFSYVFRILPSNEEMAKALATYCDEANYKKVIVLHDRSPYAIEFADAFVFNAVEKYDTEIVLRRSFFENKTDFTDLIVEIKKIQRHEEFDAIFISTNSGIATKLYKQSRDMNILVPFVGSESLDADIFWNTVREWEVVDNINKSVALTVFDGKSTSPLVMNFIQDYRKEYQLAPDRLSALGYDIIKLLAHGIKRARSKIPIKIAEALRYMPFCQAVTGKHNFRPNGDVFDKQLHVKFVQPEGEFGYKAINVKEKDAPVFFEECSNIDVDNDGISNDLDACPNNTELEVSQGVYNSGKERGCPADNDRDGYVDYKDNCLGTEPHEFVNGIDEYGCPIDTDKDKIPDYKDLCPDNLSNSVLTDKNGCTPDEDSDGIADDKDECLHNSGKEISKGVFTTGPSLGCPLDTDRDKVPDYRDVCIDNTSIELSKGVDFQGCPIDTDRDQIFDYEDICPNSSSAELAKGVYQQGTMKGCSTDTDQDEIPDYIDICAKNTSVEISKGVDSQGCPIDTDNDKIPDYADVCPNNNLAELAKGVYQQGETKGCSIDTDKDKVPDYIDNCPNNDDKAIKLGVDLNGCPIDSDEDKVPDYLDNCAKNTPVEISKGVDPQGCPIDTDQDKISDYADICPNNALAELAKGVYHEGEKQGCPVDTDKDQILDYLDDCPKDAPVEISRGVDPQGCPIDTDQDEISDYEDICPYNNLAELAKGVYNKGEKQGCPVDTDKDEILDYLDDCPKNTLVEISKGVDSQGCSIDTDKDEIFDYADRCPNNSLAELAKGVYHKGKQQGCPIDTDRDKILDYLDNCPNNSYAELKYGVDIHGCPIDSDKDGVANYMDRCPNTRLDVVADERGCVIIEVEKQVRSGDESFHYNSVVLTDKAKLELNKIIQQIDADFLQKIDIIGHTDDIGSPSFNHSLSIERANNIAQYLIDNGILSKKISTVGKGKMEPLIPDATEEERHKNRRFELIISRFKRRIP